MSAGAARDDDNQATAGTDVGPLSRAIEEHGRRLRARATSDGPDGAAEPPGDRPADPAAPAPTGPRDRTPTVPSARPKRRQRHALPARVAAPRRTSSPAQLGAILFTALVLAGVLGTTTFRPNVSTALDDSTAAASPQDDRTDQPASEATAQDEPTEDTTTAGEPSASATATPARPAGDTATGTPDQRVDPPLTVSRIPDATTVVLADGREIELALVDAPGIDEPCGLEAANVTRSFLAGQELTLVPAGTGSAGDTVVVAEIRRAGDGASINEALVRSGFASVASDGAGDAELRSRLLAAADERATATCRG